MVTAKLKNYRQSPRKVRLVVDAIRGKKVNEAVDILTFTTKRASDPIIKLVKSAIANAVHNHGMSQDNLFVKEIRVDEGVTMHRFMPKAHGRANPIRKRASHVNVVLAEVTESKKDSKEAKEVKKAPAKAKKAEPKKTVAKSPRKLSANQGKTVTKDKK